MSDNTRRLLATIRGIAIYQEPDNRIHYVADLSVDVDGAKESYRPDNNGLDDIHASAGYPHGSWRNVLAADPNDMTRPFVDADGYCVSMTSYQRAEFPPWDRRRYLDAALVPYAVPPGIIRKACKGVLLGCKARVTDTKTGHFIDCVMGDFSGNSIGEASIAAAKYFNPKLSARNGDERNIYLYEYWPGTPATVGGETFKLIAAGT